MRVVEITKYCLINKVYQYLFLIVLCWVGHKYNLRLAVSWGIFYFIFETSVYAYIIINSLKIVHVIF